MCQRKPDAWNKLPKNLQAVVLEIAAEMEDEMWNLGRRHRPQEPRDTENPWYGGHPGQQPVRSELNQIGVKLRSEWAAKAGADAQKILDDYARIVGR